ncbi:MAG: aspartate/glutamate racemase family protein [Actinobacteria bacterium]|nr:aspartate/glutamate racemase family protein [Actinomycetota bacterium]
MTMRVGLIVPSSNTVMEPDFQRELAGVASVHAARMYLADPVTPAGEFEMLDRHAAPAARDLGTLAPDVTVFGCTSAAALLGPDGDARLRSRLVGLTGTRVVGVADSLGNRLRELDASRIAVLSPYAAELAEAVIRGFAGEGFEVLGAHGLEIGDNAEVGRVEPEAILDAAPLALAPGAEALAVACTNLRALEVREELERAVGIPVVTANSAALTAVRRALEEV